MLLCIITVVGYIYIYVQTLSHLCCNGIIHVVLASVPGLPRYAIYRPVASTANMYTLASVRLLSFWLTATCSSAVKAYTYAYRTCVKRSRVYTFIHSCGRGNGARATRRLRTNVYGHVMFHPRPSPFSMFPSPAQLNARVSEAWDRGYVVPLVHVADEAML